MEHQFKTNIITYMSFARFQFQVRRIHADDFYKREIWFQIKQILNFARLQFLGLQSAVNGSLLNACFG